MKSHLTRRGFIRTAAAGSAALTWLSAHLKQIPGIQPARLPENSRAVWHLYPFGYDARQLNGLGRDRFIQALNAEGIPCGGGYTEQY